jgi:O-antigen/teichoic acid export membrane protein
MLSIFLLEAVGWLALSLVTGVAALAFAMWYSAWRELRRRRNIKGPRRFPDQW